MLPNREDLQKHYPRPKSYVEIRDRRRAAERESRPKFIGPKVAFWASMTVLLVYFNVQFIEGLMKSGLGAESVDVIFYVSSSFAIVLISFGIFLYLYSLFNALVNRVFVSDRVLRMVLTLMAILMGYFLFTVGDLPSGWVLQVLVTLVGYTFMAVTTSLMAATQAEY